MLLRARVERGEGKRTGCAAYRGVTRCQRPDLEISRKKDVGGRSGRDASRKGADVETGPESLAIKVKPKNAGQLRRSPKGRNCVENCTKDGQSVSGSGCSPTLLSREGIPKDANAKLDDVTGEWDDPGS